MEILSSFTHIYLVDSASLSLSVRICVCLCPYVCACVFLDCMWSICVQKVCACVWEKDREKESHRWSPQSYNTRVCRINTLMMIFSRSLILKCIRWLASSQSGESIADDWLITATAKRGVAATPLNHQTPLLKNLFQLHNVVFFISCVNPDIKKTILLRC